MSIEYATKVDIGNRKRQRDGINEDSVAVTILEDNHLDTDRQEGVFALADGAGGEEAGDIASYIATVEVTRHLTKMLWDSRRVEATPDETVATDADAWLDDAIATNQVGGEDADWLLTQIDEAIQRSHTRILEMVQALDLGSAYSTIVAGVKAGDRLYYGWVGDSRAYVVNDHPDRANADRISLLTRDHSVVEQLVQRGEIDPVEAHVHRQGTQITRALGGTREDDSGESSVNVDTNHVPLFGDDVVMFTSDGLIDAYTDAPKLHEQYRAADDPSRIEETILEKAVTDDEIRDVILETDSLEAAGDRLVTLANQRGGKDNISLILFRDQSLARSPADDLPVRASDGPSVEVDDMSTVIGDPDS